MGWDKTWDLAMQLFRSETASKSSCPTFCPHSKSLQILVAISTRMEMENDNENENENGNGSEKLGFEN